MKRLTLLTLLLTALAGCAADSASEQEEPVISDTMATAEPSDANWSGSAVSEETREIAYQSTKEYHRCLSEELSNYPPGGPDPRAATDRMRTKCENRLAPVREALLNEGVPARQCDRYLLKKRRRAAQKLLKQVMYRQVAPPSATSAAN